MSFDLVGVGVQDDAAVAVVLVAAAAVMVDVMVARLFLRTYKS